MASAGVVMPIENEVVAPELVVQSQSARSRRYSVHPETIYTTTEDGWSLTGFLLNQ